MTAAVALRRGDLVLIGLTVYEVRRRELPHPASVRLTFASGERVVLRRATDLDVVGHRPLSRPAGAPRRR
jgi:hypothetical protein